MGEIKEEEKEPIESYTIVFPEDESHYDIVNNVKLRPDIEKNIKKMFAESITYLETVDVLYKEYFKIIKDLMKFDISDGNNCFEFSKRYYYHLLRMSRHNELKNEMNIYFDKCEDWAKPCRDWNEIKISFWINSVNIFNVGCSNGKIGFKLADSYMLYF